LIDLKDPSRSFTWTNNQKAPIMATLDRILITTNWETRYPLARTSMLPKGVSDHNPLMITYGETLRGVILFSGLRNGGWR
jgi:endonuclease/exonuclease/phosphatase family metal-dependent hydrolase